MSVTVRGSAGQCWLLSLSILPLCSRLEASDFKFCQSQHKISRTSGCFLDDPAGYLITLFIPNKDSQKNLWLDLLNPFCGNLAFCCACWARVTQDIFIKSELTAGYHLGSKVGSI